MALPPSAFFLLGLLVWLVRTIRPEQVEPAPEEQRGEVPR
jgi:Na+-transporting NADH:ubiquinone oxidoreductase subunit D